MKELVELIKKEPGKYSVGSPGAGTTPSLSIEQLKHDLKVELRHRAVRRRRADDAIAARQPRADRLRRDRQLGGADQGGQAPRARHHRQEALETLPDIPTLDELGIKDQEAETMTGVFVPAGTPKEIVNLLQKEISTIVNSAEIKPRLLEMGVVPEGDSPAEFAAYVKADIAKWKRVIETREYPEDLTCCNMDRLEFGDTPLNFLRAHACWRSGRRGRVRSLPAAALGAELSGWPTRCA